MNQETKQENKARPKLITLSTRNNKTRKKSKIHNEKQQREHKLNKLAARHC